MIVALILDPHSAQAAFDVSDGSTITDDQWETHTDAGVALDMVLYTNATKDSKRIYRMLIYIKNISTVNKTYFYSSYDHGFRYFYTDANGIQHDMHPHIPAAIRSFTGAFSIEIAPGKIAPTWVELTANDLTFVTSHPIQCTFVITDEVTNRAYKVTTFPKTFSIPQ